MVWFAIVVLAVLLVYAGVRVWRDWISPSRDLEETVAAVAAGTSPRTYLVSGHERLRRIGLVLEDVALRQQEMQRRLHETEFSLQSIIGSLADAVMVVDRHRQIRLTNPAFARIFGSTHLRNGETLLHVLRDAAVEQWLADALTKERTMHGTLRRGTAQNEQHFHVVIEPIRSAGGDLDGAVVLFHDMTAERRTETMRRDFVANVSHEMRTPLSILRGYLETLLENPEQPPAELLRIFEVMERHAERLSLVVDDVLSLARLEDSSSVLSLTNVQPAQFLRATLRDWEKKFAAKNLRVILEAAEHLPILAVDEGRLQEVIYNLLDNAVKYSKPDSRLFVRANQVEGQICFSVTDRGVGIAARDLPRIFERFYRADQSRERARGGTGLGLAIVKHIAQLHGGSVAAESEFGRGTTMRVFFPVVQPSFSKETAQDRIAPAEAVAVQM